MGAQAAAVVDLAGHGSICVPGGSGNCIHAVARGSSTRRRGAWLGVMHVADTGDVGAGRKRGWGKFRWRRARRKLEGAAHGGWQWKVEVMQAEPPEAMAHGGREKVVVACGGRSQWKVEEGRAVAGSRRLATRVGGCGAAAISRQAEVGWWPLRWRR